MNWADLPDELLDMILSHVFDKGNFSLVCKPWEAVVSRRHPSPRLMYYEKEHRSWKFFKYNRFSSMEVPELDDAEVLCSKHGCLLMSRDKYNFFVFKLSNKHIFEIPAPDEIYKTICFFNPPASSNCFIVGVTSVPSHFPRVSIGVLKWGEDEWDHYEHNCMTQFIMSDCAPILHRGLLYFLDVEGNIGTFDIEKRSEWTMYNKCLSPARLRSKIRQIYFLKLSGEEEALFAVFLTHDERKVRVYKLLEPDMKWERVVNLGDKVLFVSRTSSFGGRALYKSMANRIYFPNKKLFYSLDTKKHLPFDGDCDFPHHKGYGFNYLNHATWIIPPTNFLELL